MFKGSIFHCYVSLPECNGMQKNKLRGAEEENLSTKTIVQIGVIAMELQCLLKVTKVLAAALVGIETIPFQNAGG